MEYNIIDYNKNIKKIQKIDMNQSKIIQNKKKILEKQLIIDKEPELDSIINKTVDNLPIKNKNYQIKVESEFEVEIKKPNQIFYKNNNQEENIKYENEDNDLKACKPKFNVTHNDYEKFNDIYLMDQKEINFIGNDIGDNQYKDINFNEKINNKISSISSENSFKKCIDENIKSILKNNDLKTNLDKDSFNDKLNSSNNSIKGILSEKELINNADQKNKNISEISKIYNFLKFCFRCKFT